MQGKDGSWYDGDYFTSHNKRSGYNPNHPYTWEYRWPFAYAVVRDLISFCLPFRTVLEVGCATGVLVKVLRKFGYEARGVDLSPWAIKNCIPGVQEFIQVGDVRRLPFPDASFDLVVGLDMLEHVPHGECRSALSEMMRVSKREVMFRVAGLTEEQWTTNPDPTGWAQPTGDDSHVNVIRAHEWEEIIRSLGWMHVSTAWGMDLCMLDYIVSFVARRPGNRHDQRGINYSPRWKV